MSETPTPGRTLDDPTAAARRTIEDQRERVRRYLPALLKRLALTYGAPLGLAVVVSTLGATLLTSLIPGAPAAVTAFLLNLLILIYGWRWLEGRTHGTSLFVVFSAYNRQRRQLERLLRADSPDPDAIRQQTHDLRAAADRFIKAMHEQGAVPVG